MILKNELFYRLVIFNTLGIVGLAAGYWYGLVDKLLQHDAIGVIYVIGAFLALGIVGSINSSWKISKAIDNFNTLTYFKEPFLKYIRKMTYRNDYIQALSAFAVLVGLFGNVWGLIEALGSPESIQAGAAIAFGSTAAGILTALWLEVNALMLRTASNCLIEDVS